MKGKAEKGIKRMPDGRKKAASRKEKTHLLSAKWFCTEEITLIARRARNCQNGREKTHLVCNSTKVFFHSYNWKYIYQKKKHRNIKKYVHNLKNGQFEHWKYSTHKHDIFNTISKYSAFTVNYIKIKLVRDLCSSYFLLRNVGKTASF